MEITPIRSIDRIAIGNGARGPVTAAIQKAYFDVVHGRVPDTYGWLTPAYPGQPARRRWPDAVRGR